MTAICRCERGRPHVDTTRVYVDSCAALALAAAHPRMIADFALNFNLILATVVGRELGRLPHSTGQSLRKWIVGQLVQVCCSPHLCRSFDDFALQLQPPAAVLTLDRQLARLLKRRGTRVFTFRRGRIVESHIESSF